MELLKAEHVAGHQRDIDYEKLVPEHWIDQFAIAGTPDHVRGRIERAIADGADEISMILISSRLAGGGTTRGGQDQLTRFAEDVLARIRSDAAHREALTR